MLKDTTRFDPSGARTPRPLDPESEALTTRPPRSPGGGCEPRIEVIVKMQKSWDGGGGGGGKGQLVIVKIHKKSRGRGWDDRWGIGVGVGAGLGRRVFRW